MKISVTDVIHYASAAILFLAGVAAMLGFHLPGITVDPAVAIPASAGILAAGLKASALSGSK